MRKPDFKHFHTFKENYDKIDKKYDLNQKLVPYFISSHPGCKEEDMANLAAETKDMGFQLEQVQDFTPTPMTVATVIYYSGIHPYTMKPYYTPKTKQEKQNQHKFFFWYKKENQQWIKNQLTKAKRFDLMEKLLGRPKHGGDKKEFTDRKEQNSGTANKPKWLAEKHKQTAKNNRKKKSR